MERFMLLFRGSEVYEPNQSAEALQTLTVKMMDWVGVLIQSNAHIASEKLQRNGVQVFGTHKEVVESPFGSLAAIVGGCTIIQAINLNEAIEIAKRCPILETNANIEVRQIQGM